jgi:DNA-binding protein HU-beta
LPLPYAGGHVVPALLGGVGLTQAFTFPTMTPTSGGVHGSMQPRGGTQGVQGGVAPTQSKTPLASPHARCQSVATGSVQMTKSQLIERIADATELSKRDVKGVMETLATVGYKELKKSGMFTVPGFAKFVVVKKPATKARKGINPFTGEPTTFKAKPARKIVRARPVKAAKDAV